MAEHKTISLNYKNSIVEIDELIVPLIQNIWNSGIDTIYSCQNVGENNNDNNLLDYVLLQIDKYDHIINFLNKVSIPLYKVIPSIKSGDPAFEEDYIWRFPIVNWKYNMYPVWDKITKTNYLMFSIMFPQNDIQYIINKLNENS